MSSNLLAENITFGGQITTGQVQLLADNGITAIICCRPDNEGADQTNFSEIDNAAKAANINSYHVPMSPKGITAGDVTKFAAALNDADGKVYAYCKTGMRSVKAWALDQASQGAKIGEIQSAAAGAGYNLDEMAAVLSPAGAKS